MGRHEDLPLVGDLWPRFADELAAALDSAASDLVQQVSLLRVVKTCGCGDDFCQGFYTKRPPNGAYGMGHRNVSLEPPWPGLLVLDVVQDEIVYVEVLYRQPLD